MDVDDGDDDDEEEEWDPEAEDERLGIKSTIYGRVVPARADVSVSRVLWPDQDTLSAPPPGRPVFVGLDWLKPIHQFIDDHEMLEEPDEDPSVREAMRLDTEVTLQECLEKFSAPETLDEDNPWYCNRCKDHRQATKTMQVWALPDVLILHFKRFEHHGHHFRDKLDTFVSFPVDGLDLSPYVHGEKAADGRPIPAVYDLFAVNNHMGSIGYGHYTAFVRDWDATGVSQQWYHCDDQDCRPVREDDVCSRHAYVLFYRRRQLPTAACSGD